MLRTASVWKNAWLPWEHVKGTDWGMDAIMDFWPLLFIVFALFVLHLFGDLLDWLERML